MYRVGEERPGGRVVLHVYVADGSGRGGGGLRGEVIVVHSELREDSLFERRKKSFKSRSVCKLQEKENACVT